jgi:hypothetical protein
MFFKRLSRSRSNSQSYVDDQYRSDSKANSAYDEKYAQHDRDNNDALPPSSRSIDDQRPHSKDASMYNRQNSAPQDSQYASPPMTSSGSHRGQTNGYGQGHAGFDGAPPPSAKAEPLPDLLTQAFNTALKPYNDKVDNLENEIADLRAYIDQLEAQRNDIHAWIDKRGLRPGESRSCEHFYYCVHKLTITQTYPQA